MPEPHITMLSVLFLLGAVQGLFFALILLTRKMANKAANRYLALLLLILATELFIEFLDHSLYGLRFLRLMILLSPTDFFYGPLLYLYTSAMTSRQTHRVTLKTVSHFIPVLIHAVFVWPLLLQPLTADPKFLNAHPEFVYGNRIQPWISPSFVQPLAALQMVVYFVLIFWRLRQHADFVSNEFSYREGVNLSWLRRLLFAMLGLYVLFVFRFFIADWIDTIFHADIVLNVGVVIVIYLMAYFGMHQPEIFAKLSGFVTGPTLSKSKLAESESSNAENEVAALAPKEAMPRHRAGHDAAFQKAVQESKQEKYKHSALTPEMSDRILQRLETTMEQEKPYLKSDLTLPDLAKMTSTSPNYLSQVINEELQVNFFDYVNSYRIKRAKQLLVQPLPHTQTVLDVALDSAFNSKSAFYRAFKKQMGVTPTEFKKSHAQQPSL